MNIVQNVALRPLVKIDSQSGWETSVGQAFKTIFYTGNFFACYSIDAGQTFKRVDPYKLAESVGHKFCCDQLAHYVPAANVFVWILLADDGPVLMCLATPQEIETSKGLAWTVYVLSGPVFNREDSTLFDYPQMSFGDGFLYLTFNIIGTNDAILCRFAIPQLRDRGTLNFQYFVAVGNPYVCPCQVSGDRGLFAVQKKTTEIRVFIWPELSNFIQIKDVIIATIPTVDWKTLTPDGNDWLDPGTKIDSSVMGVARDRSELWVAWAGARRVENQDQDSFPFPHIGIAVISVQSWSLIRQRYIWNDEVAFAYPSLAGNQTGEIAVCFAFGGPRHYVQTGVGFLRGQEEFLSASSTKGLGGGLHYITARMAFPEINRFIGGGFKSVKEAEGGNILHHPRYVLFSR